MFGFRRLEKKLDKLASVWDAAWSDEEEDWFHKYRYKKTLDQVNCERNKRLCEELNAIKGYLGIEVVEVDKHVIVRKKTKGIHVVQNK